MAEKFCVYHEGVPAVAKCRKCHKLVCKDCVVYNEQDGTAFCSEECLAKYEHFQSRYNKEPKTGKRTIIGQFVLLAGAVIVVIIAIKLGAARKVPFFVRLNEKIFGASKPPPQGKLEEPAPRR
jgi:hypothetical protein